MITASGIHNMSIIIIRIYLFVRRQNKKLNTTYNITYEKKQFKVY